MTIPHSHPCPICGVPMSVQTSAHAEPPEMPCGRCWTDLTAAQRASYLYRHRRAPVPERSLRHRDPVTYAPPTLAAYVEHLEAIVAAQARDLEALAPDEQGVDVCAACEGDAGPSPYEAPSGAYVLCAECHATALQEAADAQEVSHG